MARTATLFQYPISPRPLVEHSKQNFFLQPLHFIFFLKKESVSLQSGFEQLMNIRKLINIKMNNTHDEVLFFY